MFEVLLGPGPLQAARAERCPEVKPHWVETTVSLQVTEVGAHSLECCPEEAETLVEAL